MSNAVYDFISGKKIIEPAANPAIPDDDKKLDQVSGAVKCLADVSAEVKPVAAQQSQARDDQESARLVYRQYQENVRKGSQLETALLKDLQSGQNVCVLLLQAIHIIGLYTGNTVTETVAKETIESVYGIALRDTAALAMSADAIKKRVERLFIAEKNAADEFDAIRIRQAIKMHLDKLDDISPKKGGKQ